MKSALYRLFSWLVITAFTFQTIWPSWVMASETEVLPPITSLRSFSPHTPSFTLQTLVDEGIGGDDSIFLTRRSIAIPCGGSHKEIQHSLNGSLDVRTLYPGLQVTPEGFSWSQYGFHFLLSFKEHFFVTAASERTMSSKLRIHHPNGNIFLGEGLALEHLLLKGQSIFHVASFSSIHQMDIWATGNPKKATAGVFRNSEKTSLSTSRVSIHDGNVDNLGYWSIAELLDLKGHHFTNHAHSGLVFSPGAVLDNVFMLKNSGRFSGSEYRALAHYFYNIGDLDGSIIAIGVQKHFENKSRVNVTTQLSVDGPGTFYYTGSDFSTPRLIVNTAHFENLVDWEQRQLTIEMGENTNWKNTQNIILKHLILSKGPALAENGDDATIEAETLTNHRDNLRNQGTMTLGHWEQQGRKVINESGATVEVTKKTTFKAHSLENQGEMTFGGEVHGRIEELRNQGGITFESAVFLTGTSLVNGKNLRCDGIFSWQGTTVNNQGTMRLFDNHIQARQVVNHQLLLWQHNQAQASHFLNLGWAEQTDQWGTANPKEKRSSPTGSLDTTTDFKDATFENRGVYKRIPLGYTPHSDRDFDSLVQHWLNSGDMTVQGLHLHQAKTFHNSGSFTSHGEVCGEVESFENTNKMHLLGGTTLSGNTFTNLAELITAGVFSYGGHSFLTKSSSIWTALDLFTLKLDQAILKLYGTLNAQQGFSVDPRGWGGLGLGAPNVENHGRIESPAGETTLKGYFTNYGFANIAHLLLEKEFLTNREGQLFIQKLTNLSPEGLQIFNHGKDETAKTPETKTQLGIQGGFKAGRVDNTGHLSLESGWYVIDHFYNHDGTSTGIAEIDQLSLLGAYQPLYGEILIHEYIDRAKLQTQKFSLVGNVTILKGHLCLESLLLRRLSHLTLGHHPLYLGIHGYRGYDDHLIRNLEIEGGATFTALPGMRIKTDSLQNGGVIESGTDLRVTAVEEGTTPKNSLWLDELTPSITVTNLKASNEQEAREADLGNRVKLGVLKAQNDIKLEFCKFFDVAEILFRHGKDWQCNGQLSLYGEAFLQTKDINLALPLFLKVANFWSISRLSVLSLNLITDTLQVGINNDQMGMIETTERGLHITTKNDAHLEYARLYGKRDVKVKSTAGDVLIGEFKNTRKVSEALRRAYGGSREFEHQYVSHEGGSPYNGRNGSYIASEEGRVILKSSQRVLLKGAEIHVLENYPLEIKAETYEQIASVIDGRGSGEILAAIINIAPTPAAFIPPWQLNWNTRRQCQVQTSDMPRVHVDGDLTIKATQEGHLTGGIISSNGAINEENIQKHDFVVRTYHELCTEHQPYYVPHDQLPNYFYARGYSFDEFLGGDLYRHMASKWGTERAAKEITERWGLSRVDYGVLDKQAAQIMGKTVYSTAFHHDGIGYMSGVTVRIEGGSLSAKKLGKFLSNLSQSGIQSLQQIIDALAGGLYQRQQDGTLRSTSTVGHPPASSLNSSLAVNTVPVLNYRSGTNPTNVRFYCEQRLMESAFRTVYQGFTGFAVDPQGNSPETLFRTWLERSSELARGNRLTTAEILRRDFPLAWFEINQTAEGTSVLTLSVNFPESLRNQNAGRSNSVHTHQDAHLITTAGGMETEDLQVRSGNDATFTTTGGNMTHLAFDIDAEHDVDFTNTTDSILLRSTTTRHTVGENFDDSLNQAKVRGGHRITGNAAVDLLTQGIDTCSGIGGTSLTAERDRNDQPSVCGSQTVNRWDHGDESGYTIRQSTRNTSSHHYSDGIVSETGGNSLNLVAPQYDKAKQVIHSGGSGGINIGQAHDTDIFESFSQSTDDGFGGIGGGTETQSRSSHEARSVGMRMNATDPYLVISQGDVTVTGATLLVPKTIIMALDKIVRWNLGTNHFSSQTHVSDANAFWQSMSFDAESHKTYSPNVSTGDIEIYSKETIVQVNAAQVQANTFLTSIHQHGGRLTSEFVQELHDRHHIEHSGPTLATCMVLALAVSVATAGAGAHLGGIAASSAGMTTTTAAGVTSLTTAGATLSAMTAVSFTSLCSKAAVSLLVHKGDLGKAAKDLASTDTLKSIAIAAGTAGILKNIGLQFKLPTTGTEATAAAEAASKAQGLADVSTEHLFSAHLLKEGLSFGVTAGVQTATGAKFEDLFKAGGLSALANTVGGVFSSRIGEAHYKAQIPDLVQESLHALSGGIQGFIQRGEKGIAAGALGAFVAETVANVVTPTGGLGKVASKDRPSYLPDRIQLTQDVARVVASIAALLAGMDVQNIAIAIGTATIAVENNFAKSAQKAGQKSTPEEEEDEKEKAQVKKENKKSTSSQTDEKEKSHNETEAKANTKTNNRKAAADDADAKTSDGKTKTPHTTKPSPLEEPINVEKTKDAGLGNIYEDISSKADVSHPDHGDKPLPKSSSHQQKPRSVSPTSKMLAQNVEQAKMKVSQASNNLSKYAALVELQHTEASYDERQWHKQDTKASYDTLAPIINYVQENPHQTAAGILMAGAVVVGATVVAGLAIGATTLSSASIPLGTAMMLGGLSGTIQSQQYCQENNLTGIDALSHSFVQTATSALEPLVFGAKPMNTAIAGASLYATGTGMNNLTPGSGDSLQNLGLGLGVTAAAGGAAKFFSQIGKGSIGVTPPNVPPLNPSKIGKSVDDILLHRFSNNNSINPNQYHRIPSSNPANLQSNLGVNQSRATAQYGNSGAKGSTHTTSGNTLGQPKMSAGGGGVSTNPLTNSSSATGKTVRFSVGVAEGTNVKRDLLPGEGKVGTYRDLYKQRTPGDNLTPNHMPQAAYMKQHGVSNSDGIAMWMEQPHPGTGGRHRQTRTYGNRPDLTETPRVELARDIANARTIYQNDGVYTADIRQSLQEVINLNKTAKPDLFIKK